MMGFEQWMRVVDAVTGLAQFVGRKAGASAGPGASGVPAAGLGGLETRLAGVVVAALKEAFDRDRVRMDLERAQVEEERRRAEQALAAELRRQAAERALGQLRLIAIMAIGAWMLSAALAIWLPNMRTALPRVVLGAGWGCSFAALGCAFAGGQQVSAWTVAASQSAAASQPGAAATAAPWLLLASLALIGASLLVAL
jgi:hypothetical protein